MRRSRRRSLRRAASPVAGRGARSSPRPRADARRRSRRRCGVGVDEVDVGGEIQLAAAELAQAEHDQPLHAAVGGRAPRRGVRANSPSSAASADLQARFGQARAAGERGVDVVEARHVAPDQARRFGGAVAAQQRGPFGAQFARQHQRWRRRVWRRERIDERRLFAAGFRSRSRWRARSRARSRSISGAQGVGTVARRRSSWRAAYASAGSVIARMIASANKKPAPDEPVAGLLPPPRRDAGR